MRPSRGPEAVLHARAAVLEIAGRFTHAARPILAEALTARLGALVEASGADLPGGIRETLPRAAEHAIRVGVDASIERLRDPDVWLSPHTTLEPTHVGARALGALDDPSNRVWIALLGAARVVDPLLAEFGLRRASGPDLGGGHFGLQPRSLPQLDPSGRLARLWREYRPAYGRYARLLEATA
jgi:hypothetical protein